MQIVSLEDHLHEISVYFLGKISKGDNLHEVLKSVFSEK